METADKVNPYIYFLNGHDADNGLAKLALDDIKNSGLSPEILRKAKVRIFNGNSAELNRQLGYISVNGNQILSIGVLVEFPYPDSQNGTVKCEYRLFPETDGRRYLHPLHSSPVPYIVSDVWDIKEKVNKPIWLTEGVKKVLKLIQHGAPCIGLSGVWGFRPGKKEEATALLSKELESFSWKGRTVYLAFDTDLWTNQQVRKALYELALHLITRGALVYICTWKGAKGIDDYLAGKTDPAKELSEIQEKARQLTSFVAPEHRDDILYALSKSIGSMDELTKESTITALSKKLNIRPKSIYKALLKEVVEESTEFTEEEKEAALKLLKSPTLIKLFFDICHTRYVGRDKILLLIKLATMTRHLQRGLSIVLLGTSSVGKSALIDTVLATCDPAHVENFSRTSAQYLLYRTEPLEHKVITFYEFNGADSSSAIIRTALTEGVLHLGTVQKDAAGSLVATEIRKETQGLVILSTFTGARIDAELSTRVLLQEISHDEVLAREVYRQKAEPSQDHTAAYRVWACADSILEGKAVTIPYLPLLANLFPTKEERFHRDFDKTVMLIKASALLHQYQRDTSDDGAVIAGEADYRLIHSLGDAFAQSLLPVSVPVLHLLAAAKELGAPTRIQLQDKLGISESTIKRYIRQARQAELIETEGRGQDQLIKVLYIPGMGTVLPSPEDIFENECVDRAERVTDPSQTADDPNVDIVHPRLTYTDRSDLMGNDLNDGTFCNRAVGSQPVTPPERCEPLPDRVLQEIGQSVAANGQNIANADDEISYVEVYR